MHDGWGVCLYFLRVGHLADSLNGKPGNKTVHVGQNSSHFHRNLFFMKDSEIIVVVLFPRLQLPWKSLTSIIEYYYMWKTTDRYVQQVSML